ncbi:unnamed protein product [Vitrella brassicaformis CCMP3155]|uniref:BSD domain-containing protein n=1 Tax=Vitrella brassicaformis (strain CCMP3155) TaxID=1169540 RepID=A0A0G4E8A3_VITBC|nr:unnamed protein product [Vitrella brassicaformis CCMP3155]|eukprot:CEL91599.1 unnamed protein product [Vitrella brassicaformis CCMP3155]
MIGLFSSLELDKKAAEMNLSSAFSQENLEKVKGRGLSFLTQVATTVKTGVERGIKEGKDIATDVAKDFKQGLANIDVSTPFKPGTALPRGSLPWGRFEEQYEVVVKDRVLQLTESHDVFMLSAPPSFAFQMKEHIGTAHEMLEEDPRLDRARFELVPKRIKEDQFWRNYFWRVEQVVEKVESELREMGIPHGGRRVTALQTTDSPLHRSEAPNPPSSSSQAAGAAASSSSSADADLMSQLRNALEEDDIVKGDKDATADRQGPSSSASDAAAPPSPAPAPAPPPPPPADQPPTKDVTKSDEDDDFKEFMGDDTEFLQANGPIDEANLKEFEAEWFGEKNNNAGGGATENQDKDGEGEA